MNERLSIPELERLIAEYWGAYEEGGDTEGAILDILNSLEQDLASQIRLQKATDDARIDLDSCA